MKSKASPFEILSRKAHFHTQWLGNPKLNEKGLHLARIRLSDRCIGARRLFFPKLAELEQFHKDGIVVIPNFLPETTFTELQTELRQYVADVESKSPFSEQKTTGFGPKQPFAQGFDRYDGSTLNRFINIEQDSSPQAFDLIRTPLLRDRCRYTSGSFARPSKFSIYQTVHGNDQNGRDIQKAWHRDTFQQGVKLWYYIEDVKPEDGPFEYIPGSHKMNKARMDWEYERSIIATTTKAYGTGGAFRIQESEFDRLGLRKPCSYAMPANTLVMADVRGFHRRGYAEAGKRRLSIYANFRPYPFSPVPFG